MTKPMAMLPGVTQIKTWLPLGIAGRGWRSLIGMIALFVGGMTHLVAVSGARRIDTTH